jgi:FkbM family methyltransferase
MKTVNNLLKNILSWVIKIYLFFPKLIIKLLPDYYGLKIIGSINENIILRPTLKLKDKAGNIKTFIIEVFNYDTKYRVETFFSKEPLTLDWIDKMSEGSVFWDIGANIGLYSIYAANKGLKVIAFEPSFANYYALNRNIFFNNLHDKIKAFCIALADDDKFGTFNMADVSLGGAFYTYDSSDLNDFYYPGMGNSKVVFRQGSVAVKIDNAITNFNLEVPTYIKIDVDGIEKIIMNGGLELLMNPVLEEILIEINTNSDAAIIETWMHNANFKLKAKEQCDGEIYNYLYAKK